MKTISIVVVEDATVSSIDFAKGLFSKVNDFLVYRGQQPMFAVALVGTQRAFKLSGTTITIETDKLLGDRQSSHYTAAGLWRLCRHCP